MISPGPRASTACSSALTCADSQQSQGQCQQHHVRGHRSVQPDVLGYHRYRKQPRPGFVHVADGITSYPLVDANFGESYDFAATQLGRTRHRREQDLQPGQERQPVRARRTDQPAFQVVGGGVVSAGLVARDAEFCGDGGTALFAAAAAVRSEREPGDYQHQHGANVRSTARTQWKPGRLSRSPTSSSCSQARPTASSPIGLGTTKTSRHAWRFAYSPHPDGGWLRHSVRRGREEFHPRRIRRSTTTISAKGS